MEGTLRRVRSPPAALWTETLDNLWRINWLLRSFSLWARHPAETSAELNVRLGAAEFFPGASRQVRRVRKRRRGGNARAAQGTASGRESYTIQTCDPSVSRTAVRWGPQFSSSAPPRSPAPSFDHFPLWAQALVVLFPSDHAIFGNRNFVCNSQCIQRLT